MKYSFFNVSKLTMTKLIMITHSSYILYYFNYRYWHLYLLMHLTAVTSTWYIRMSPALRKPSMFTHITHLHKKLQNPNSPTNVWFLCTKIKLGNFFTNNKNFTMFYLIVLKLWKFKALKLCQNLHVNMEGFHRASHICDRVWENRSYRHNNWYPFFACTWKLHSCTTQKHQVLDHSWPGLLLQTAFYRCCQTTRVHFIALEGINRTAWGTRLLLTPVLASFVDCISLCHKLKAHHCSLSLSGCFSPPSASHPPPPPPTPLPPAHPL